MIETKPWPENNGPLPVYPYSKWNVWQWFMNEEGIDPSYEPTWPFTQREVFWFFRNFMFNFFRFVVGVEDRRIVVTGTAPVFTTKRIEESPPSTGWKFSVIRTPGYPPLPFMCYSTTTRRWFMRWLPSVFYVGWVPSGGRLGLEFNWT